MRIIQKDALTRIDISEGFVLVFEIKIVNRSVRCAAAYNTTI